MGEGSGSIGAGCRGSNGRLGSISAYLYQTHGFDFFYTLLGVSVGGDLKEL
jgi:hypothetical protein